MVPTQRISGLIQTPGQGAEHNALDSSQGKPATQPVVALQSGNASSLHVADLGPRGPLNPAFFSKEPNLYPAGLAVPRAGAALVSVAGAPLVSAKKSEEAKPTDTQRYLAQGLIQLAGAAHFTHPKLDDSLSSKIFDRFIEKLDSSKHLFTQEEEESLEQLRTVMDDLLLRSQLEPMFKLYEMSLAAQALYLEYAASVADDVVDAIDPNAKPEAPAEASRPASAEEQEAAWNKSVESLASYFLSQGESKAAVKARLSDTFASEIAHIHKMTGAEKSDAAFDIVMDSFLAGLDPHSTYISPKEYSTFMSHLSAEMVGIGIQMKQEYRADESGAYKSHVVMEKVVAGGPSAGKLHAGDALLSATGTDGKTHSLVGVSLRDVSDLIKGENGSTVTFRVQGADGGVRDVQITRGPVALDSGDVQTGIVELADTKPGAPQRIGVIHLPQFFHGEEKQAGNEVAKALEKVKSQGIDALVFDLRDDGGGALPDALQIAGLFIPEGPVTQIKEANGAVHVLNDPDPAQQYDGPMAVLINRHSASASELVAAAMQDYGRAVIMGERSHGKGSVQQVLDTDTLKKVFPPELVQEEYGVKLTMSKFYRVSGGTTQTNGVEPDVNFSDDPTELYGERMYPTAMPSDNIPAAEFVPTGDVTAILAAQKQHAESSKSGAETPASGAAVPNETLQQRIDRKGDDWLARAAKKLSDMYAPDAVAEGAADAARKAG